MQKTGLFELNAVVAVATHRSFRRAAAELGLSPSALSHAVAALEQRLGVRLFHRTTRSVSLTQAGEQFLTRLRPALRDIDEAMESVNRFRESPSGTLRINTSEGAAQIVMAPIVVEFLRRCPDVRLHLITDNRLVDIVADGFDAGIRLAESVPQGMVAVPCTPPLRFSVVATPEYFARHGTPRTPADLTAHNCIRIRFPSGAIYRWEFSRRGQEVAVDVDGSLTLDNHALILDAALQGVGIALTSEFSSAPAVADGRLLRVLQDWTQPYPGLCVFYPPSRHPPASLRAFIDVARESLSA